MDLDAGASLRLHLLSDLELRLFLGNFYAKVNEEK
jgi:hypothetical protein